MNQQCELSKKSCKPCKGGIPPLKGKELAFFYNQIPNDWKVIDEHHLEKEFVFPTFRAALSFTNKVAELAEQENHHPDIHLSYGKVTITLWTHKIDGLSESDFILASKCDPLYQGN
jgi:4a-hydroxytetrahydrobiopterin dehydratase